MKLAIFGAQGYALGTHEALRALYPRKTVSCFLVTKLEGNPSVLGGIPVKELAAFSEELSAEEKRDIEILIATPENVQPEIEESLERYGFLYYSRLTTNRWAEWMKLLHAKLGKFVPLSALPVGCHAPFVRIYMAKSHKDTPLRSVAALPEFIFPIQAGAGCCGTKICNLTVDTEKKISEKNKNYSELTALYWIWKNKLVPDESAEHIARQYYGLAQYRRVPALTEDDLLRLVDNDVDAVLPYPLPYEAGIHAHHERYLKSSDWAALLAALEELQPEYARAFPEVLAQRYLYNYNVILAKTSVLRDYCQWLFPILERTEQLSIPKGTERADRYIGYMGETLETLYFMRNAPQLNIVHTACRLLV